MLNVESFIILLLMTKEA